MHRLTQALEDEHQRAETEKAKAEKLVRQALCTWLRSQRSRHAGSHTAARVFQEEMYNRLKHKYTNLKRSIREISGCASQLLSACCYPPC